MLALTRKVGERIVIGDNIVVTLISIKGDNIRLAIEAPKDIKIYRGEIYDAIAAENRQAAVPHDFSELDMLKQCKLRSKVKHLYSPPFWRLFVCLALETI